MPHCQKENHNRAAKSKKERQKAKQEAIARKKRVAEEKAALEAEAALKQSNNIAPVEGHGAYEIGCEPEPEYHRFNVKKRSKKHLRNDLRKKMLREQREEEERLKKEREEDYRRQQLLARNEAGGTDGSSSEEEEEEEEEVLEYLVYICECCDKKYATKNQFLNHCKSKKHKSKVRIYEELGLLVTHVELRGHNGNEKDVYDDDEADNEDWDSDNEDNDNDDDGDNDGGDNNNDNDNNNNHTADGGAISGKVSDESDNDEQDDDSEDESDEDDYVPQKRNIFAGFAAGFGSSSSSEEDDSDSNDDKDDDKDDDNDDHKKLSPDRPKDPPPTATEDEENEDDAIDFDELIHQNQLIRDEIDANNNNNNHQNKGTMVELPTPLPFHETYDPDDYGVNENRLVSVQHRLRKNLAARGIEPRAGASSSSNGGYDPFEAITVGKTLLRQVLEANIDTLQQKLDAYNKHKEHCQLMSKQFALAGGNSKALPAQYVRKQDAADNARRRANVHHAGSHYHMQAARTMQFGRQKGLMARHSSQGARLQASRMAAKETARMQQGGGGMKIGKKSSKKSNQKKRGEAGGSKKSGGSKGGGGGGD
mmetsp:Transcript_3636/g.7938  ORF Transcript_3636/g.7938 Transcript_3636/m.7938 type:complete len:593 (+) Transcript_3636:85-1863(+)